jgi:hypothetical protein
MTLGNILISILYQGMKTMKRLLLLLLISISYVSHTSAASLSSKIRYLPAGTKLTVMEDLTFYPDRDHALLAIEDLWDDRDWTKAYSYIKLIDSSPKERILRTGRILTVESVEYVDADDGGCSARAIRNNSYNYAKIYIDHPVVDYIFISNGSYVDVNDDDNYKCHYSDITIKDLHLSVNTDESFSVEFVEAEEL